MNTPADRIYQLADRVADRLFLTGTRRTSGGGGLLGRSEINCEAFEDLQQFT